MYPLHENMKQQTHLASSKRLHKKNATSQRYSKPHQSIASPVILTYARGKMHATYTALVQYLQHRYKHTWSPFTHALPAPAAPRARFRSHDRVCERAQGLSVCICVCVCVRERCSLDAKSPCVCVCVCVCVCLPNERKWGKWVSCQAKEISTNTGSGPQLGLCCVCVFLTALSPPSLRISPLGRTFCTKFRVENRDLGA